MNTFDIIPAASDCFKTPDRYLKSPRDIVVSFVVVSNIVDVTFIAIE